MIDTDKRSKWPDDFIDPGLADVGVRCPKCNCPRTHVDYTRHKGGGQNFRRRTCDNCGKSFPTYERSK